MTFNTTSYLAGVGSVVVVLSTGFAGGYFLANPTRIDPPNRLQRLAAEDHSAHGYRNAKLRGRYGRGNAEVAAAVPAAKPQASPQQLPTRKP